jgi:hypothetical protein
MTTTWTEVGTSAAINMGLAFLFLFVFSIVRVQPQNARVYFPKWYIKGDRKASTKEPGKFNLKHYVNTDYKVYLNLLGWMWEALKMPEEELIEHAGLDSAVFLRIFLLRYDRSPPI